MLLVVAGLVAGFVGAILTLWAVHRTHRRRLLWLAALGAGPVLLWASAIMFHPVASLLDQIIYDCGTG